MAGSLTSVLLFITIISSTLILITALNWATTLPFFHPSREDVQKLLISLEDLLLPMGSFLSELLEPWAPKEQSHESNHSTLPLSMTPAPESGRFELDWQSPTSKPTHADDRVKPLAVPCPPISTLLNGEPNSTMIPPSAFPTPNVDILEPSAELPTSAQAAFNRVSSPEASFTLIFSSPNDDGLTLSAMSPWTRRQSGNVELNAAEVHSFTNPTISGDRLPVLDNPSDQASSDSPRAQQSPKENPCNVGSAVDVLLPEQTVAETDALGKNSDTMSEEVQKDQKQEEEDSTAAAEEVSTESKAPEQQVEDSTAAVEEVPTENQAFEVAIRGLVDPDGSSESNLEELVALVADVLKGRAEAKEKLNSEIIRFSREEEDLRHNWIDQREYIESVINGQNEFVCEKGVESNRIFMENSRLDRENCGLREELKDQEEQYKREIEILQAEKQFAENAETTALADVEGRIGQERERHEKERLDAVGRHMQEINSQVCMRQMVLDRLNNAEDQHEDTIKDKNRTIRGLKAEISRMEPAVAAAVERETSTKEHLEKQLKDQLKKKDRAISFVEDQLREAKKTIKSSSQSISDWRLSAQINEGKIKRLSDRLDEETATLRENRDYVVADLKRDKEGLERSIRDGEAVIHSLEGRITDFESGHEVRSLQRRLRAMKKKLQKSEKEAQNLTEELQKEVKTQGSKRLEEAKRASGEKDDLKEQFAEAIRVSEEGRNRTVQELKGLKEKLSRETEDAQSREQRIRADIQRVQDEKGQIAMQHQKTVREKDEEIMRLREAVQLGNQRRQSTTEHEMIVKEKDEEILRLQQAVQLQDQWRQSATEHETIVKEKDEEIRRLQQAVKTAKDGEIAKNREIEEEQAKVADEKAAKDAANAEKMTLQHQLDDERQASRVVQDKATETETSMRNEIIALKSEGSKVDEPQSHDLASNQTNKEAQEVAVLRIQASDANNLLWEIGKTGVVQGSPEHSTLCELNEAKFALYVLNRELRKNDFAASKSHLDDLIGGLNVNEERIQQFSLDTPQLVKQAKKANARLRRLQKILDTDADVQKMLEALHTEIPTERVIRKPRALKRPGSGMLPPNTSCQAGNVGQSEQTHGLPTHLHDPQLSTVQQNLQPRSQAAIPPAQIQANAKAQSGAPANGPAFPSEPMPKRDHRRPFMELLASVSPTPVIPNPVIQVHAAPHQEPAAEDQSLVPGGVGDSLRPVSPRRPIRNIRARGPQLAHSASANESKKDNENRMPQMPVGWTEAMTEIVRLAHDDTIEGIEMSVMMVHPHFKTQDEKGLHNFLRKLQSDFKAEKSQTQQSNVV